MPFRLRRRAFSVLEVLVVIAILGILAWLGMAQLQRGRGGAESHGLAEVIAEELRLARKLAQSRQVPVGVGFPSGAGTVGRFQSLYLLEGEIRPRVSRVANFGGDFPGACGFAGYWPVSTANSTNQPLAGSNADALDLRGWPTGPDPVLIFTPAGTVTSNGMVTFDGNYHLAVSEGLQEAAGVAPPPGPVGTVFYAQLQSVCAPFTIVISPLGAVRVQPGLTAATAAVTELQRSAGDPAGAAPPVAALPPNTNPSIDRVTVLPQPADAAILPPGVSAFVSPGDHVTLRVEALDNDPDDPLYCQWTTVPAGAGVFSAPAENRMEWDPTAGTAGTGAWVSVWEWRPPLDIPPGSQPVGTVYTLECTVQDREGGAVVSTDVQTVSVSRAPPDRVMFNRDEPAGSRDVMACRLFGNGLRKVLATSPPDEPGPVVSPDGQRFAYLYRSVRFGPAPPDRFYYVANTDGSDPRQVSGDTQNSGHPSRWMSWSPDSSRLVVQMMDGGGDWNLYILRVDGSDVGGGTPITSPPVGFGLGWETGPLWAPQGDRIVFLSDADGSNHLYLADAANPANPPVGLTTSPPMAAAMAPTLDGYTSWDPTGQTIAFAADGSF
ncbi:MAG: prepilin-type N-terminal cleavage/methylation domain-containing protein, partial [Candidatus Eremiobacterota bacterium]